MLNDTKSEIIIEMHHIDDANKLKAALIRFKEMAGVGGDVSFYIGQDDKIIKCGNIGHDIDIKKISHTIYT